MAAPNNFFKLSPEGAEIERSAAEPQANCAKCVHFKTCGIWRSAGLIEQQFQEPKVKDFFKVLPMICPNYDVSLGSDLK